MMKTKYRLSITRVVERLRQIYLKPIVSRDPANSHEALDTTLVETQLKHLGAIVEPYTIDWQKFLEFQRQHSEQFGRWRGNIEKQLEYFISRDLLDISSDDMVMDVGSWFSPYPDIIRQDYGAKVYAQDLMYPDGIHDWQVGGDAGNLPLSDGSVSRIALHCTFEHFERDSDIRFIREAARVLKPGGRMVIVPLYIHQRYTIWTDPSIFASASISIDAGASLYKAVGWNNQFGRHYSPEALQKRVLQEVIHPLRFKILSITNVEDMDRKCYVRFIGVAEKTPED